MSIVSFYKLSSPVVFSQRRWRRLFGENVSMQSKVINHLTMKVPQAFDALTAVDNSVELVQSRDKVDWDAFVIQVNKSLDVLDLEFRHLLDESSGKEMYAVVGVLILCYEYISPAEH